MCVVYRGLGGVKVELKLVRCTLGVGSVQGVRKCEEGTVYGVVYIGCAECTEG